MRKGWLITGLIALVVVGGGLYGAYSYGSDDKLPEGFNVGGLAVGGQRADSAIREVQTKIAELEKTEITVTSPEINGQRDIPLQDPTRTLKQLGMTVDAAEAVKAMEDFLGVSWWGRAKLRYGNKIKTDYGINVVWDDDKFRKEAASSWGSSAGTPPKEATRAINDRDEVVYTPEVIGTELDIPALMAAVKTFEPKSILGGGKTPRTIALPVTRTLPKVTAAKLKEEGIERKIVEFTTSFATSGEGRSHNVTAASKALDETLLMPGEVFEYGKIVAKAEKEYGYKEAPVILKGKLTPGIGGGICQISSTLYNAALLTGLEIVERRNHSLVVHYLPKGLDATFAEGYVNFKFRNSTGKQLLIRTVVKYKTVTVKFFGTMPEDISYRTETAQVKVIPPKTVYVANGKLALGKQETLQKGEAGYVIESYLVKTIDGELVERKKLSKDTYRTQDSLIAVNPNDPRLNPEADGTTPAPEETPVPDGDVGPVEPI